MTRPVLVLYAAAAALSAAAVASAGACAHVEAPPGGEPDSAAPRLESTRPDTFARLRSYLGPVIFQYNEGLSEKGVDTVVTVSPRTSGVVVDKGGSRLSVSLRRGWEANRVYQVTVHPGLGDLFGNMTKEAQTLVFSTGPEIVPTVATGQVVLRTTLEPARGAVVELVHRPDSTVYETRPDSAGRWTAMYLPEGDYLVRAYNDTNHDEQLQPYEARDTTTIRVARRDTARARRLAIIAPDSTAPKAGGATGEGDVITVTFDDYLDPAQPLTPAQVTVVGPNNAAVAVREVRVGAFPEAPTADSAARDTGAAAAARRDSAARAAARRDSAARAAEPVPSQSLAVRTAQPLRPETQYTVTVRGVRNLVGLVGGGSVPLRTGRPGAPPQPAPQPARGDTAGARRDTSRVRPAPPRPGGQPPAPRPQTSPAPVATPPRERR